MSKSRASVGLLALLGAATTSLALAAPAAMAEPEPATGYKQFNGCLAENPGIEICMRTEISGGHFQMGSKDVPITSPITIIGGTDISSKFEVVSKEFVYP